MRNTAKFPDVVEADLLGAGWYPGRIIDTVRQRKCADDNGLPYHETADVFLQEFGGITISSKAFHSRTGSAPICLDLPEIMEWLDVKETLDDISHTGKKIGTNLALVGIAGDTRLYMNEAGTVFCDWSGVIMFAGASGSEALTRLLTRGGPLPTIA